MIIDSSKIGRWIIPLKEFSRLMGSTLNSPDTSAGGGKKRDRDIDRTVLTTRVHFADQPNYVYNFSSSFVALDEWIFHSDSMSFWVIF